MLYLLIIIFGGILSYFLPWWIVAPVCLGFCFWKAESAKQAFGISSAAIVSLWIGYATYLNLVAEVDLVSKIGNLFAGESAVLQKIPKLALVFTIMTMIASAIGGFSGLAGFQLKRMLK